MVNEGNNQARTDVCQVQVTTQSQQKTPNHWSELGLKFL